MFPLHRWHRCFGEFSPKWRRCALPASSGWRLCRRPTSVTSFTPRRRATGTGSGSLTCSWAASPKRWRCSWKPKAPPSPARRACLQGRASQPSRCPWSSTPGETVDGRHHLSSEDKSIGVCSEFFQKLVQNLISLVFLYSLPANQKTGSQAQIWT